MSREYLYRLLFDKIKSSGACLILIKILDPAYRIEHPSEHEKILKLEERNCRHYRNRAHIAELMRFYDDEYCQHYSGDTVYRVYRDTPPACRRDGVILNADHASEHINIMNGYRITPDMPDEYDNDIYLFGNCWAFGACAEDRFTVAGFLQKFLNERCLTKKFRVRNAATRYPFEESMIQALSHHYSFNRGDMAVFISHDIDDRAVADDILKKFNFTDADFLQFYDLSGIFERPHEHGELFLDRAHTNHRGYRIVASALLQIILRPAGESKAALPDISGELAKYVRYLKHIAQKRKGGDGVAGCIVMNCNPFTRGHMRLIQEALKQCGFLYVFVVDENKSFFSFDERLKMVKEACKNEKNISILPTGKMILSADTFSEYFTKEEAQDVNIDAALDLEIFAGIVAPILGLKKRFAGSEPFCNITRQYNAEMRRILPQYGVEFVEMPREKSGDREISASEARQCLLEKNLERLRELVPQSTYEILAANGHV
ncbi:MAG: adenylyltransferase/cytidyltransferase family protein [Desulfovibrio sp.]|jgi:[citrate (pro-3S)-lyase] ligase|nr:adenylyltransferase/cytidyltransferase family protein [Desulfovibrio sp.]